jgi:hypothetical protein
MMRRIDLVAVFLVAGLAAAIAAPVWDAKDGVIFPPEKAKTLLKQCSRDEPNGITGYWLPQTGQIVELEHRLPALLERKIQQMADAAEPHGPHMPNYLRQYAGLLIGGRKVIYVNGFPGDQTFRGDGLERRTDWRTKPVLVCDGYIGYFGVEYDPETRDFAHLVFNGIA